MYVNLKLVINNCSNKINYKKIFNTRKFIKFLNNFTLSCKSYDFNEKRVILYFPKYKFKFYKSNIKNIERNEITSQLYIFIKTKPINYSTSIKKTKNIIIEKRQIDYSIEQIVEFYLENLKNYYKNKKEKFNQFNSFFINEIFINDIKY